MQRSRRECIYCKISKSRKQLDLDGLVEKTFKGQNASKLVLSTPS